MLEPAGTGHERRPNAAGLVSVTSGKRGGPSGDTSDCRGGPCGRDAPKAGTGEGHLEAAVPRTIDSPELEGHGALDTVRGVASHVVLPGMTILLVCLLVGTWLSLSKYTMIIPESAWTVFFSCVFGFFVRLLVDSGKITSHKYVWASSTFLNLALLPIIMFESGWSLNHLNFMSQVEFVGIFAVFGTLISFFFVGLVGMWLGSHGFHVVTSLRENLVFAALISAVDPVATLCTFSKLGLDSSQPLLHTMIFGESVINDAVAIVLFWTINSGWEQLTVLKCVWDITVLLFGSALFGVLLSGALVLFLRGARLPGRTYNETLYIMGSAWFIFAASETVGLSGIIANLCAGSIFRVYGSQHLEQKGLKMTTEYLEVSARMCDTMVFILCGASTAMVESLRGVWFAVFGFLLCLIGRALSTSTCALISNSIKACQNIPKSHFLSFSHQIMMWHAGLRGGIALVLALEIDASWCEHKATIINATFIIICCTLLFLGSSTETMLRLLGFSQAQGEDVETEGEEGEKSSPRQAPGLMSEIQAMSEQSTGSKENLKASVYMTMDSLMQHVLVGDVEKVRMRHEHRAAFIESLKVKVSGAMPKLHNYTDLHKHTAQVAKSALF